MDVDKQKLIQLWENGTEDDRKVLRQIINDESMFEKATDKIATYEDACKALGITAANEPQNIPEWLLAIYKLNVITRALNGGWVHPQDGTTKAFHVRICFIEKRIQRQMITDDLSCCFKVLSRDHTGEFYCGLGVATSTGDWLDTAVPLCSRLAYKSHELADYSATQFRKLWARALCVLPDEVPQEKD